MSTALTLVIILLVMLLVLLTAAVLMYYFTQQDLRSISARLSALDAPKPASSGRTPDAVRRERSAAFDTLVMLEANLSTEPREELGAQDLEVFEAARRAIKASNAELKRMQSWLGLPYDLEWGDIKQRVPKTAALYRKAVEAAMQDGQPPV